MFGMGFWEMVVVGIVLIVVVGPKQLPSLLRSAGRGITKLKNMSSDLRQQSGIDEVLRDEGLNKDIDAIRSLHPSNLVGSLVNQVTRPVPARRRPQLPQPVDDSGPIEGTPPARDKEYPELGCDSYGTLPDGVEPPPPPVSASEEEPKPAVPPVGPKPAEEPA